MTENGEIISLDDKSIRIKIDPSDNCESCSQKCNCKMLEGKRILTVSRKKIKNRNLEIGKKVKVESMEWQTILSTLLIFVFPVIILALTYIIVSRNGLSEGKTILGSFISFTLTFLILAIIDRAGFLKSLEPEIKIEDV